MHSTQAPLLILFICLALFISPAAHARTIIKQVTMAKGFSKAPIKRWKVYSHEDLKNKPELHEKVLQAVTRGLADIEKTVYKRALLHIRQIPILLYHKQQGKNHNYAYYDPNLGYVVFPDADLSVGLDRWNKSVLLHELAHGFHDQELTYQNAEVIKAFHNAVKTGIYKKVQNIYGNYEKAYALTNHMEYFAEISVAFFSRKGGVIRATSYPFTMDELKKHDQTGYRMLLEAWQ